MTASLTLWEICTSCCSSWIQVRNNFTGLQSFCKVNICAAMVLESTNAKQIIRWYVCVVSTCGYISFVVPVRLWPTVLCGVCNNYGLAYARRQRFGANLAEHYANGNKTSHHCSVGMWAIKCRTSHVFASLWCWNHLRWFQHKGGVKIVPDLVEFTSGLLHIICQYIQASEFSICLFWNPCVSICVLLLNPAI